MSINKSMESIISLCRRRGFVFQNSEIYGGLKGVYDFGPLGIELKKNLRTSWWKAMIYDRTDMEGLEASILSHPKVWAHSGHTDGFCDPLVECNNCKKSLREDKIVDGKCEHCGGDTFCKKRELNLMMQTQIGCLSDCKEFAYLRGETAQSTYVNFKNILNSSFKQLPFGICQQGKSFRNEISPRNFVFRMVEFEQLEMQYFVNPKEADRWFNYWKEKRYNWWLAQGLLKENLKFETHSEKDLSHYAKEAVDISYKFLWGLDELEGIHNRQDFDLGSHTKNQKAFDIQATVKENKESTTKLNYQDVKTGESYIPYIIETAAGGDRGFLALMTEAYNEEKLPNGETRIVLKLKSHLSPIKVAVIPLVKNNEEILKISKDILDKIQRLNLGRVSFDNTGNVGRSYRRNDEIGTPLCITVDFNSLETKVVTIRDRDSMKQIDLPIDDVEKYLEKYFKTDLSKEKQTGS